MARLAVLMQKCEPAAGKMPSLEPRLFGGKLAPTAQKPAEPGPSTSYRQPSQLSQSHSAVEEKDEMAMAIMKLALK